MIQSSSPRFHFNSTDLYLIVFIIIHGSIGIILTLISEVFLKINYGNITPIVTVWLSLISSILTQYVSGKACTASSNPTPSTLPASPQI